jgi:hypothetical protein
MSFPGNGVQKMAIPYNQRIGKINLPNNKQHYCPVKDFARLYISLLINELAPILRENYLKMKFGA